MRRNTKNKYEEYEEMEELEDAGGNLFRIVSITVFLLLVAGFIGSIYLFEVKTVHVEGNVYYTDEEIQNMILDDTISKNTVLVSFLKKEEKISNVPLLESIEINYVNRNTIRINVNEKEIIGYVEYDDKFWYFDQDGIVIEATESRIITAHERVQIENTREADEEGIAAASELPLEDNIPFVQGLKILEPENGDDQLIEVGRKIHVENDKVFFALESLKQMINKDNIPPEYIEFDANDNLTLHYENIQVCLGQDEDLENKMATLASIMPKIQGMSGVLHLENYSSIQEGVIFEKSE